ncbi:hypothetical protein XA68_14464 [Ophiocordyceps unilateralis]|uniref:Ketoreductase domain-containing protein n=1 Tax=Ophiocordyceps unilateralis TaxID=268505 RepID=A0A2A9PAI4_OPHUN|nr:hypothetical protein XA68_14464 [Ophiocordyceps unilateralis]
MPSKVAKPVQPPAPVVVTGANGFIAQHCVAELLANGYRVVGTVRTESKAEEVRRLHGDGLIVVVVPDITDSVALTATLAEHEPAAVLHLAGPFHYQADDFERDLMRPAVGGAVAVLEAAAGLPTVQRVVYTSSFAGIYDASAGPRPGKTYSARDWSPLTYGDGARAQDAPTAYRASKTVAERAAWAFIDARRPAFDLVSLCPAMVFGPLLSPPASVADLNTSNGVVWSVLSAGRSRPVPPTRGPVWVDVRDVARAHLRALQVPEAAGRRFLLAAGVYCNQELADVGRRLCCRSKDADRIPLGRPGQRESDRHFAVDASDAESVLGLRFRALENCLVDLVPQLFDIEHAAI